MSYLDVPRLHFAGRFMAAISTVNNDPAHFDNAKFQPEFQLLQTPTQPNGWFAPRGDADWRLIGCEVTGALMPDGSAASTDSVLKCLVADSDRLPPAKLVDLDSEQQLVSTIWGLEMRICDAAGVNLLRGTFEPAAFMDIWTRSFASSGGDNSAAAMYQSQLSRLEWGDVTQSPFLSALRTAAKDGHLSVKFNVDGVNLKFGDPDFLRGRITGTIGVAGAAEPVHFVRGRQLTAVSSGIPGFPIPAGGVNTCVASVDKAAHTIHVDLGNALPTSSAGGPLADIGPIALGYIDSQSGAPTPLGAIPYRDEHWYDTTAGVASLTVTDDQLAKLARSQVAILKRVPGGTGVAVAEAPSGLHVRADQFVYRLDPGSTATVKLYASAFGRPYPRARIKVIHDPYQLQGPPFGGAKPPGIPPEAVQFPDEVVADATGLAVLPIFSRDPGNPRDFIDGQVYGIRPMLAETVAPGALYPFNMWEFISVLVFDVFEPDEPPTWWGSLQPIFQQYANLYPIMGDFVDLGDYEAVCAMRDMMLLAFEQSLSDPNSMPVTRDLSTAKRAAILRWLREVGVDGKPLLGPLPPPAITPAEDVDELLTIAAEPAEAADAAGPAPGPAGPDPSQGGKAVAMTRRLAFGHQHED
jgi:hypothetical protein